MLQKMMYIIHKSRLYLYIVISTYDYLVKFNVTSSFKFILREINFYEKKILFDKRSIAIN